MHSLRVLCLLSLLAELSSTPLTGFISSQPQLFSASHARGASLTSVRPICPILRWQPLPASARLPLASSNPLLLRRPRAVGLRMQDDGGWGPNEPDLSVKVNLCMLRSPAVPWYNGGDMCESDVTAIMSGFEQFVTGRGEGWLIETSNETGVYARAPGPVGPDSDITFALLGLGAYKYTMSVREVTSPAEPYMQFMLRQFRLPADDTAMAHGISKEFTEWALKFAGKPWLSSDVPASGLGGVVAGDAPTLDQTTVIPPTSAAVLQKAITGEDRPFWDTSALTDWLLPSLALDNNSMNDDLGVAGTTPIGSREIDLSVDLGMMATEGSVPKRTREKYELDEDVEEEEGEGESKDKGKENKKINWDEEEDAEDEWRPEDGNDDEE